MKEFRIWSRNVAAGHYNVVQGDSELSDLEVTMAIARSHMFSHDKLDAQDIDNLTAPLVRS
jgi:hypothetical protein